MMKLGLKLRPGHLALTKKYSGLYDFFELYVEPSMDLKQLDGVDEEVTIHTAHSDDNFNIGDPSLRRWNEQVLRKALDAADLVNSKWVIVHPGHNLGKNPKQEMISFLENNFDKKIIIENCPSFDKNNNKPFLFSTPKEMKNLLKKTKLKMLLDFAHANITANLEKLDYNKMLNEFLELEPRAFHLCGFNKNDEIDNHLHLWEGNADYSFLKKIPKNKYMTFETPHQDFENKEIQERTIKFVRKIVD